MSIIDDSYVFTVTDIDKGDLLITQINENNINNYEIKMVNVSINLCDIVVKYRLKKYKIRLSKKATKSKLSIFCRDPNLVRKSIDNHLNSRSVHSDFFKLTVYSEKIELEFIVKIGILKEYIKLELFLSN